MNSRQIKDLFNMEEMMVVDLQNSAFHLNRYIAKLDKVSDDEMNEMQKETKARLSTFFNFYKDKLIPALDEILEMDKKHGELLEANPDRTFTPIAMEFRNHKNLTDLFFERFEDLHKELFAFLKEVKS